VNAFAECFYEGNSDGVIELDEFLDDELMIAIAKENGYAHTAFYTQDADKRGTILTAGSSQPHIDFVSRWFGGKGMGIDEDHVTGSAHCLLTPYCANELSRGMLNTKQVSPRGGNLLCEMAGDRVKVSGEAFVYLKGEIRV